MASYEQSDDEPGRFSDLDSPPHTPTPSSSFHDIDESDALRKAARAGILLLEKNEELQDENAALRAQLAVLERERPSLRAALVTRDNEVAALAAERAQCLVEVNALRSELKATAAVVTDALNREQQWRAEVTDAQTAQRTAEHELAALALELHALRQQQQANESAAGTAIGTGSNADAEVVTGVALLLSSSAASSSPEPQQHEQRPVPSRRLQPFAVTNPAATYDVNQTGVFTWSDYEKLLGQWQAAAAETDALQLELRSARKELDSVRKQAARASELFVTVERLEKRSNKLALANDALSEELAEERALRESLRSMNLMYKQLAESRPFAVVASTNDDGNDNDSDDPAASKAVAAAHELGATVQDVLLDTNLRLETELRETRDRLALYEELERQLRLGDSGSVDSVGIRDGDSASITSDDDDGDNNSSSSREHSSVRGNKRLVVSGDDAFKQRLRCASFSLSQSHSHSHNNNSSCCCGFSDSSDACAVSDTASSIGENDASNATALEALARKVQTLQAKLGVARDMLRHTKLQWSAAVASQKALEQCNRAAQDEITRLTQQLDHQVASLSCSSAHSHSSSGNNDDDDDKWVEETAPYPAPPGDLNSPLIKCLLDHWTADKPKIMALTDWLHHAVRGTGKPTPLRLQALSSEVAAGFAQLLVPILRERHGVGVSIYRRDSVHVLSDLVLQTTRPSTAAERNATHSGWLGRGSGSETSVASLSAATDPTVATTSTRCSSTDSSSQRPQSRFLRGETHFLYG